MGVKGINPCRTWSDPVLHGGLPGHSPSTGDDPEVVGGLRVQVEHARTASRARLHLDGAELTGPLEGLI